MEGYDHLSTLIAKVDGYAIFRLFKAAHVRNLLYLQAELNELEVQLAEVAKLDRESEDPNREKYGTSFGALQSSAGDGSEAGLQWRILEQERKVLKEYTAALFTYNRLLKLSPVVQADLKNFRAWMVHEDGGQNMTQGRESDVWKDGIEADLTSLSSRPRDSIVQWLENTVIEAVHNSPLANYRKEETLNNPFTKVTISTPTMTYSDTAIARFVSVVSTILSSLLPTAAIFALYFVNTLLTRMYMILAFNICFSVAISVIAKANRVDCFAATAAFAAVQVVFIGGSGTSQ